MTIIDPTQTSLFDDIFADSDEQNRLQAEAKLYAHLPSAMPEGIAYFRGLIARYNEALLAADIDGAQAICDEAHDLAYKLGGYESGILAKPDSAGRVLDNETAAPEGQVPLWGQRGNFQLPDFNARIEMNSIFGIGSPLPGFAAHAIDRSRPFLSPTGYRSFLGLRSLAEGLSTADYVCEALRSFIARELRGKLCTIT